MTKLDAFIDFEDKAGNALLNMLPSDIRRPFLNELRRETLDARDRIPLGEGPARRVYFPIGAMLSTFFISPRGSIELHSVGSEGVLGTSALQAVEHIAEGLWICQLGGNVMCMRSDTYEYFLNRHAALTQALKDYTTVVLRGLTQSVACNGLHSIAQRCARWLLLASDRTGSLHLGITHEALGKTLGVRRAGVSVALQRLQLAHIVDYQQGVVMIVDRERLLEESCECYLAVTQVR